MATKEIDIERSYRDNFDFKEYTEETLVPKYFSDMTDQMNDRTVGLIGMTTEQLANISEDTFNTSSVLFRETFPNRAQIPESIYSHAAIFQLSNAFSSAASCLFLIVMDEEAIIKNMVQYYDPDSGIYHFYIDKDTMIIVEGIKFVLDYDVELNIVKRVTDDGDKYLFTANYVIDYNNSVSEIVDTYVKVRRSADGFVAIEVQCHQCYREVYEDTILSNSLVNYTNIDIDIRGKLAGFDVIYRPPSTQEWTQLDTKIIFSQAQKTPFCYYEMLDEDTLRITFNSRDTYFMPEFNSDIKVIMYITEGTGGNFEIYEGNNIKIIPTTERYSYSNTYLAAAEPLSSSQNGKDQLSLNELQALAVEGYRTANALTTENDLSEYFNNYVYRYGDADVLFLRKRDDVYERIYSAFIVMREENYIFNTNTLKLAINIDDMANPEKGIYTIDPGYLFTANEPDGYASFYRDPDKYAEYYAMYLQAVEDGTIPYIETTETEEIPPYLDRAASYATFKARKGLDDKVTVFDLTEYEMSQLDDPSNNKFLLVNPFLIRFKKDPNLVTTYLTTIDNNIAVDFTDQNDDSYVQFIIYKIQVSRTFEKEKRYKINLKLGASIAISDETPPIDVIRDEEGDIIEYIVGDKYNVGNDDLRVFFEMNDGNGLESSYCELYPSEYDVESGNITFEGYLSTDDHITSTDELRLLDDRIYRFIDGSGKYYKVHDDDNTLYGLYDKDGNLLEDDIPVDEVIESVGVTTQIIDNIVNLTTADEILVGMEDVNCRVYTLYHRYYSEETGKLEELTSEMTNNKYANCSDTLVKSTDKYMWTNKYETAKTPVTFIKSLKTIRTYLSFMDYTEYIIKKDDEDKNEIVYLHDIMDLEMNNLSFIRWNLIFNKDRLTYFISDFYNQYMFLSNIIKDRLRNITNIDVKFYNTYGRSKNFVIGEDNEQLDTVNLSLYFDIWYTNGTDLSYATPEVKRFIKEQIEQINEEGYNNLYISNLMRKIENNFDFVDHIRFIRINNYPTDYQAVKSKVQSLDDLSVEERRFYVPEMLVCATDNIYINEYIIE